MQITFKFDIFGAPIAVAQSIEHGFVASVLTSDLQTPEMCDLELNRYSAYESDPDNQNRISIGNSTRRELVEDEVHLSC